MDYICRFYINGKFKLSCHSRHYKNNYIKLCERYGEKNVSVEKILIDKKFDFKLYVLINRIRNK